MKSTRTITVALIAAFATTACSPKAPEVTGGAPIVRRLTDAQYRNIITDVFGPEIVVSGEVDPIDRMKGLIAVGASFASIMPTGFERYDGRARSVAAQVVAERNRDVLIPCRPADAAKADEACAKQFLSQAGRFLLRRPLTDSQLTRYVTIANAGAAQFGFYDGMGSALTAILVSPSFLYVKDQVEADPARAGAARLDAYSKAARLSFLLWNSTPDAALLTAAETGALHKANGLRDETRRLLASPRVERGTRAFFADMLNLDRLETMQKDSTIYPSFSLAAAKDAGEQTLRTISDFLVGKDGDYRNLFTLRETYVTAALGLVYQIPVPDPTGWAKFTFAPEDRRAGLQNQLSFVALHSHPGKSSPTLRGRAIRELLMCQNIPDPPGDISFQAFNDPNNPNATARERLAAHSTEPSCAGCHKLMDPIGLTMETFDGAGMLRTTENDHTIDATGDLDGVKFEGEGLGKVLHDNPATTSCVVMRAFEYALGRPASKEERPWLEYFDKSFVGDKYRFLKLMEKIATSPQLYAVVPPQTDKVAMAKEDAAP